MKYKNIIIRYFVNKAPRSWAASSQIELSDGTGTKYQNIKKNIRRQIYNQISRYLLSDLIFKPKSIRFLCNRIHSLTLKIII